MTTPTERIPRTPTFEELADRAWANMNDWLEGRRSWENLGPHPPYTPDVIAAMDLAEVTKWLRVFEAMEGLADRFPTYRPMEVRDDDPF